VIKPAAISELIREDPYLAPYRDRLEQRAARIADLESRLTRRQTSLMDFASGHEYFGFHLENSAWICREWAPYAAKIYLRGGFTQWRISEEFRFQPLEDGVWELRLPESALGHGDLFRLHICWPGGAGERIPAYARRVVQDPRTHIFNAQVWRPPNPHEWQNGHVPPASRTDFRGLLIYEAHVGMAQERPGVGSYLEFADLVLPRIVAAGYNTLQLMAIPEHPYYGSFGYQVANFFAPSSRFGTPEELKELVDRAHGYGLTVLMDIVHSHAVANEVEGLSRQDGSLYQYFHDGPRGFHPAWSSRCFDYGKIQVLHFLLSNCRYWLDEFRFDGFRFDGITSMLYLHHGLERSFSGYDNYFDNEVDEAALTYLALANRVVHQVRPQAITIAEDMSGMPALARPLDRGGVGFDYRFAMGVPDYWIRLTKEIPDQQWPLGNLWHELTNRRSEEATISYAESHDQALVGDQTLIFRLMGDAIYHHMQVDDPDLIAQRATALHKMIRLITLATAGGGYLNFMGNEFGHPEWIDFPREGNQWSYHYARRQWSLADDPQLKYRRLQRFDRDMLALARDYDIFRQPPRLICNHDGDKVLAFLRAGLLWVFNFHPWNSYSNYGLDCPDSTYRLLFHSDEPEYGGHGRLQQGHVHPQGGPGAQVRLYLPHRTALVLLPDLPNGPTP